MTGPSAASPKQALLPNLLLSLAVVLLLAGGLEAICRVLERRHPPPVAADYISKWEQQWEGEFYTIRSEGVGWPTWEEFNGDGLRDVTHAREKPEGITRLVFLGDSVTLGAGIEPAQAYPQVLQSLLDDEGRPVEVFNVGLWGWSTRQERLAYQKIARAYRPDQVVLAVCLNDIPELQNNLSRPPALLAALHERSALVRKVVNAGNREIQSVEELLERPDSPKVRAGYARFFAEVRALRDEVVADGARFGVLVFPFRFQVLPRSPAPAAQDEITRFCAAEKLPCLDLLPGLRQAGAGAFVDYDHLSPEGARLTALEVKASALVVLPPTAAESFSAHGPRDETIRNWLAGRPAATAAVRAAALEAVDDPAPAVRRAGLWALGRLGPTTDAEVERCIRVLADPSEREDVRGLAARVLGAFGASATSARPALFAALHDPRAAVRWPAARALSQIGSLGAEDVAPLSAALRSGDPFVRGFAAWTLGGMGPAAAPAVPVLIEALRDDDGYGRAGAANALARLGPLAKAAVPALLEGLKSADGERRWKAARALGRIGPAAAEAVPALTAALGDENEYVRAHAARALGRLGSTAEPARDALKKAARDPDQNVRKNAAEALEALKP